MTSYFFLIMCNFIENFCLFFRVHNFFKHLGIKYWLLSSKILNILWDRSVTGKKKKNNLSFKNPTFGRFNFVFFWAIKIVLNKMKIKLRNVDFLKLELVFFVCCPIFCNFNSKFNDYARIWNLSTLVYFFKYYLYPKTFLQI